MSIVQPFVRRRCRGPATFPGLQISLLSLLLTMSTVACAPVVSGEDEANWFRYQLLRLKMESGDAVLVRADALGALKFRRDRIDARIERLHLSSASGDAKWPWQASDSDSFVQSCADEWPAVRSSLGRLLERRDELVELKLNADAATAVLRRLGQRFFEVALHLLEEEGEAAQVFRAMDLARMSFSLERYIDEILSDEFRGVDGGHWSFERTWFLMRVLMKAMQDGDDERGLSPVVGAKAMQSLAEAWAERQRMVKAAEVINDSAGWMPGIHEARRSIDVGVRCMLDAMPESEQAAAP